MRSIFTRIRTFFKQLYGFCKRISWRWLLVSFFLFSFFLLMRFPFEKLVYRFLDQAIASAPGDLKNLKYEKLEYSFPSKIKAQLVSLQTRKGGQLNLFDNSISANPNVIWSDALHLEYATSGVRYSQGDLFVRANLQALINADSIRSGFSEISGNVDLRLEPLEFSDLKKLLSANKKAAVAVELFKDKIPAKLHFNLIHLQANLEKRQLVLNEGEFKGKEINGRISGRIQLRENSLQNSTMNLKLTILSDSPIFKKMQTELSLMKGMKLLNEKGDIEIPLQGTFKSPRVKMNLKPSL